MVEVVSLVLHNNVPDAIVDNVDVPLQLFTTFTEGVEGVAFIVKCNVTTLSHPLTFVNVCVGVADEVYVLPYQTKLTQAVAVVSALLLVFGAATPEPDALVQPFTVCVTVYVPAAVAVINDVVSAVLHSKVPAAVVDNVEVPTQLFTTVTIGVDGVAFGAATPEPDALVQPFTVCVTVYVPAALVVIDDDTSDMLHSKVPAAVVDSVDVPSQLFTTLTVGVDGVEFIDKVKILVEHPLSEV